MEALGFLGDSGFRSVEPDGRCGIGRCLGIGDLAGEYDTALDCLRQYSLTRLRILIPAKRFARQERITEPLEGDEGMAAAFGFSQGTAQLTHAGVKVSRVGRIGSLIFIKTTFGVAVTGGTRRTAHTARTWVIAIRPLEVDADLVFFR